MQRYYQTVCRSEDQARDAFHAMDGVLEDIEGVTSYALKRHAESLLWRFDDELPVVEQMLVALRQTGLFTDVREIPEELFWSARSYGV